MIFGALALAGAAALVRDSGTRSLNQTVQAATGEVIQKKENHKKQSRVACTQYLQGKTC